MFTAKDIDEILKKNQPKQVDTLVRKPKNTLPTKAELERATPKAQTENKAKSFAKTVGYRSAADATNTIDALTYTKQYKMADNKESSNRIAENASKKNITLSARQRMQTKANNLVDKDKLVNQTETTKNLQKKAAESETRLKQGNGPIANALIDVGLAGTDMLSKAAIAKLTGVPIAVQYGLTSGANTFQNDINQGKDIDMALKSGVGSGLITGGIESLTGIGASKMSKAFASKAGQKLLTKVPPNISAYLTKANDTVIGKVLKDAVGEGLEEGIEYDAQRVYRNLLYDENTPRDIKAQAYNVLIGASVGGLFGGGRAGIDATQKKPVQQIIQENPIEEIKKPTIQDIVKENPVQELSTQSPKLPTVEEIVKSDPIEEKKLTVQEIVKQNPIEEISKEDLTGRLFAELEKETPDVNSIKQIINDKNFEGRQGFIESFANPFPDYDYNEVTKQPTVNENIQGEQTLGQGANFAQNANNDVMEQIKELPIQNNTNVINTQTKEDKFNKFSENEKEQSQNLAAITEDENQTFNMNDNNRKKQSIHENKFLNNVTNYLGVSKYADKRGLKKLVNELSQDINNPEKVNEVFKKIVDEGIVTEKSFYNQYKDLKKEIKQTKLYISDKVKSEFPEYNDFKKSNMGKLTLTSNKDDMQIDSYYQELSEKHPEMFPDDIENAQDQLWLIAEIQNNIVKTESKLQNKESAREEFDKALESFKNDLNTNFGKPQNEKIKKVTTDKAKKLPSKSQLTILTEAYTRLKQAQENNKEESKVADILTSTKQNKLPINDGAKDSVDAFKRKFVDSGNTIATVSQLVKDSTLYTMYNNARQARQSAEYMLSENQTDAEGNVVGKSLVKIFEPIRKRGDDYYKDFSKYMFNRHNMARMEQGKPVFGESKTAEISEKEMMQAERLHPEYVDYANEIYEYNRNLMQYRIDTGLISQEQANIMNEMYPNYVPTYRDTSAIAGSRATNNSVEITNGIKKATGSDKDLLPLHEQIARQTMQVIQAGKRNMFGNRLLADVLANKETLGKYIQGIETKKVENEEIEEDIEKEEIPELKNTFVIFNNGERTIMKVNSGMFEGVKAISSTGREVTSVEKGAKAINSTFKKLITAYNPLFTVKNIARDIQDAGLYSKDINAFIKAYPKALKEISTNGELWQKYQALGGFESSIFDYEQGYLLKERNNKFTKGLGSITDKVESINFVTEQMPRFTEFMATLENGDGSYQNLMEAMYNAADVTVNFGRSGTWGKVLNSTFVPFFNPAVQGFSKMTRLLTETKGSKQWTQLVIKAAALGIVPSVLNALMYDDDDEYKKINDRDKDVNYIFKVGSDQWLKIPKGRVIGLVGNAAQRTLRSAKGEEDAWAGFINTAADNTLPMNPFTETIIAPIVAVANNKTWYGTPIESQSLQNFKPSERYDEKTDSFSIALGKALNYSPKKINYILDAYTGVIGDFALPLMTKKAETNPIKKAFTIDSTLSNKIAENFYNKLEEVTYNKNSIDDDNVNDVVYRFINKQSTAVSDLSKEMKIIEKSDLTNKEKQVKVKELKAIMNGIQQNALDNLKEYERTANKYFREYKDVDDAYIYTNKDLFGAEYALKTYNKKVYEKYLKQTEMNAEEYFKWYFEQLEEKRENAEEKKNSLPTIKTKTTTKPKISLPTIKGS